MKVTNISPNLVDHIDYMIGGSIANKARNKIARAKSFPDLELVEGLESKIFEFKVQNKMI